MDNLPSSQLGTDPAEFVSDPEIMQAKCNESSDAQVENTNTINDTQL